MLTDTRLLLRQVVWATLYVLAGSIGRSTVIDDRALSLAWPAAGVAALWLCTGRPATRRWDVAVLGATVLVVNVGIGSPAPLALALAAAVLLQSLAFLALTRRLLPEVRAFGGTRTISCLADLVVLILAASAASLVGAAVGHLGRLVVLDTGNLATFTVWWGRGAASILVLSTLGLLALDRLSGSPTPREALRRLRVLLLPTHGRHLLETWLLLAGSALLYVWVFVDDGHLPLGFLLLVATVLAGVRLPPFGAAVHGLLSGAMAVWLTLAGQGPFAAIEDVQTRGLVLQLFVATVLVTGLVLAFSRQERDDALADLEESRRLAAERAAQLTAILENMREGIAVVQDDGRILVRNPAGRRLLGIEGPPSDTVRDPEEYGLRHPDGRPVRRHEMPHVRALAGEDVPGEDFVVASPDASGHRVLEIGATPLRDGLGTDERRVIVNFRDVTRERQDRDHLAAFAGEVAHDLFNPLTIVTGWAESLGQAFDDGPVTPAEGTPMVARIQAAAAHMRQFIDDLLAYTVARDHPLNIEEFDLSAAAEGLARLRRDGETRPRIDIEPGIRVRADQAMTRQLLDNLLGNAVKYVGPGVRPRITVSAETVGGWCEVSVTDNGIGVPPRQRERVFDDFHRAHEERSYRGTGIGLAICRRVVERHGGTIRVEDNPLGPGSRFLFTLPAVAPALSLPDAGPGPHPDEDLLDEDLLDEDLLDEDLLDDDGPLQGLRR